MTMTRDEFVEFHVTGVLARAEVLRGYGVLPESPELVKFAPKATTDIERRIERYIFGYHERTGEWPRVGQVMSTTRQSCDELMTAIRKSTLFELRDVEAGDSTWKQRNGGLLASKYVVLLYMQREVEICNERLR